MGHRTRHRTQILAIEKLRDQMNNSCMDMTYYRCITLVIDNYNFKLEPMSARETKLDHYGKRPCIFRQNYKPNFAYGFFSNIRVIELRGKTYHPSN